MFWRIVNLSKSVREGMQSSLWQAVLGEIELSVSRGNFITWFKNTILLRQDDEHIVIGVPNVFIKSQMEKKYDGLINETLQKVGAGQIKVEYKIHSALTPTRDEEPIVLRPTPGAAAKPTPKPQAATALTHAYRQGLNERYTFDNFIVGSGNELAYAACQAVAANPGTDPWIPGEGTEVVLPTVHLLPDAELDGLVIKQADMR